MRTQPKAHDVAALCQCVRWLQRLYLLLYERYSRIEFGNATPRWSAVRMPPSIKKMKTSSNRTTDCYSTYNSPVAVMGVSNSDTRELYRLYNIKLHMYNPFHLVRKSFPQYREILLLIAIVFFSF